MKLFVAAGKMLVAGDGSAELTKGDETTFRAAGAAGLGSQAKALAISAPPPKGFAALVSPVPTEPGDRVPLLLGGCEGAAKPFPAGAGIVDGLGLGEGDANGSGVGVAPSDDPEGLVFGALENTFAGDACVCD